MNFQNTLRRAGVVIVGTICLAANALYPDRPIQLVVPFPPGGSTDVVARIVAQKAQQILGQPITIQNQGGAGSIIGSDFVAKSTPDGYTLLVSQTAFAVNASLMKKLPYDTQKDFVSIALLADHPGVVVAQTAKPFNTFPEFVNYAKARPGLLNYSSAGNGTWPHLSMAALANDVGLNMVHVAYRGTGPAKMDLVAGRVDVKIEAYATTSEMIKDGRLKILAVTSSKRMPELPNIPTIAELGYPQYETSYWMGIVGRAGIPKDIVSRLEKVFVEAMNDPGVIKQMAAQSIYPRGLPGKDLEMLTNAEIEKWAKVVRSTGIQQ